MRGPATSEATVQVTTAVKSTTSARRSVWGALSSTESCAHALPAPGYANATNPGRIAAFEQQSTRLHFTACDRDGLVVGHKLPNEERNDLREFIAFLARESTPDTPLELSSSALSIEHVAGEKMAVPGVSMPGVSMPAVVTMA